MPKARVNRRHFLTSTAAGAALAACSGASQPEAPAVKAQRKTPLDGPLPEPNGLNIIVICADTVRSDHLGFYGGNRAKTPNLDAFASQSVVFENTYADVLPTIPCRRVFFTGRSHLHEKSAWWRPLLEDDATLPMVLKKAGYHTGFVTDVFHYFKPGMNFHRGFDSFEFIRGQETDAWISGPRARFDPTGHMPPHHVDERYIRGMTQYMMNTQTWKREDDYFAAQVCQAAMTWLERSAKQAPFFLWIDSFDPHEPWDAPRKYQQMYRDDYGYERYLFGYPIDTGKVTSSDYPVIADLYRAEVSFVDHWVGRLLEKIDSLGLADDTIVVFGSDHGTHLGEQGCVQKTPGLLNGDVAHLPLAIRHPDKKYAARRVPGLVSARDYMPTLLDLIGLGGLPGMDGANVWNLAGDPGAPGPERTFFGYANFAGARQGRWHYFQHWRGEDPGKGPALYDLEADPAGKKNVIAGHPEVVAELRSHIAGHIQAELPS